MKIMILSAALLSSSAIAQQSVNDSLRALCSAHVHWGNPATGRQVDPGFEKCLQIIDAPPAAPSAAQAQYEQDLMAAQKAFNDAKTAADLKLLQSATQ